MKRIIRRRRVIASPAASQTSRIKLVDNETLDKFSPAILGLGDVSVPSREVEAISAVFDLAGFTKFCNQVDPHLAVPKYLSNFLDWLFDEIKAELTERNYGDRRTLWADLPFLAKFLGDGVILLWNTRDMSETLICSIVAILHNICDAYKREFYPKIRTAVGSPPTTLRCGAPVGMLRQT